MVILTKNSFMLNTLKTIFVIVLLALTSCNNKNASTQETKIEINNNSKEIIKEPEPITKQFKDYWYNSEAEITSYKLEQARYGEIREGSAILVFVTEPFLSDEQVKADRNNSSNISVLKLNATKEFKTGVYPYSIMQSIFYPVANNQHALKISCSIQEWCGHVYTQLNNRDEFEITSHSYFENEADENFNLSKSILENELWTQLRINPKSLPTGNIQIVPSFEFLRLRHVPLKSYNANAVLNETAYTVSYPDLDRGITINFKAQFPYEIESWEEKFISGFGDKAKKMSTKATRVKTIKSDYWNKNSNNDSFLRQTLGLN